MDTDFMSFKDEEYFPTFTPDSFLGTETNYSANMDEADNYSNWGWEHENDEMTFMPVSSNIDAEISNLSISPPSKLDFHRFIFDWQQMIQMDTSSCPEPSLGGSFMGNDRETSDFLSQKDNFDLTSFTNDSETTKSVTQPPSNQQSHSHSEHKRPIGGKKVDLEAQQYIIDDPEDVHVDVETISENGSPPVLEARDLDSLLEQFEATEVHQNSLRTRMSNIDDVEVKTEVDEQMQQSVGSSKNKSGISKKCEKQTVCDKVNKTKPPCHITSNEDTTAPVSADTVKSKQILDALPEELILRIKESGKRKPISVIPPIPTKKRCGPRMQEAGAQLVRNKILKLVRTEAVQLDHDYCSSPSIYPKHPKKDSGFESSEEDERSTLRKQPTVKNEDGRLMVSLLKVNTLRPNAQKRKLNLDEYKKRRVFSVKSNDNSQNSSPFTSRNPSPVPEDENIRRQKHQEKLTRMAIELLNTPAKANQTETIKVPVPPRVAPVAVPVDMEMKTLLSVGTNTDDSISNFPVVEEIKPLLQNAKISTNSLITSVIENIPKVKSKKLTTITTESVNKGQEECGENKTIVYSPKNRPAVATCDVCIQTDDLTENLKELNERRRESSTSSTRTGRHRRRRSSSGSSRYSSSGSCSSSSSTSSSRSTSRSRSRSISPWCSRRKRSTDRERIQEVEERRVVYVGRLSYQTTREDLRKRFQSFGPITSVSVHFREHGDNYGFVTFLNKLDAYQALEHGNDDPFYPKYDLSFGGRRMFCKTSYSDLDNMHEEIGCYPSRPSEDSFDSLLRKAQEQLRKRKL